MNDQVVKIPNKGRYSQLELEERNEHLQEELKVCRKKIEELEAEMARLTSELRVAEKNELLATREARELRKRLAHFPSES
jgi:predicted RNase H-like nuclease (RuvC/YqgF family)